MSGQAVSIDWNLDVDSLADQLLLGKTQAETSAHVSILDEPLQGFCSPATLTLKSYHQPKRQFQDILSRKRL